MKNIITCANCKCKFHGEINNKCHLKNVAINSDGECASFVLSDFLRPNVKPIDTRPRDEHTNMC